MQRRPWTQLWICFGLGILIVCYPTHPLPYALLFFNFSISSDRRTRALHCSVVMLGLLRMIPTLSPELKTIPVENSARPQWVWASVIEERRYYSLLRVTTERGGSAIVEAPKQNCEGLQSGWAAITYRGSVDLPFRLPREIESEQSSQRLKWISDWSCDSHHSLWPAFHEWRLFWRNFLTSEEAPLVSAIRRALVLGDGSSIPRSIWNHLNFLGLSHLLVVSGSHLTWILGVLLLLFRRRSRVGAQILGLLAIAIWLSLVPLEISVLRAFALALAIYLVGLFWPALHRYPAHERVAIVGILFLLWNPLLLFSSTYVLSFGASYCLLESADRPWWKNALLTTTTALILVWAMGLHADVFSIPSQFVLIPLLVGVIFPACLISVLLPMGSGQVFTEAFVQECFDKFESLAEWVAHYSATPLPGQAWTFVVISGLILWVMRRRLTGWVLLGALGFILLGNFMVSWLLPPSDLEMHFLDVGHGDSILLRTPEGVNVLFDGGGVGKGQSSLLPYLKSEGISRIDLWAITHFDSDHKSAYEEVGAIVKPLKFINSRNAPMNPLCFGHLCLHFWVRPSIRFPVKLKNRDSLVCMVEWRGRRVGLMLGDLDQAGERDLMDLLSGSESIPILKVGHHGSKSSSAHSFIQRVRPQVAVVTTGRNNQFQFPHDEVLQLFRELGSRILRTDALGNFKVSFDF